ncbi:SDR family oxidoreductase [Sungkyunkwania multivorans]|uniref:SDR family oxidoreductase n=1 Tax=Sungkyunkwania multivorans TaxID=1173618 RepID=A0ABW3CWS7_9FLAO
MKNVLVTGVSSGIGKAVAQSFLNRNYRVFGSVRNEKDAERLQNEFGENFVPLLFDITDQQAIDEAKKKLETHLDGAGLDCLVNNAGVSVNGPLAYIDLEQVDFQMKVNVLGLLRVTQAFLPLLGFNSDHRPGRIVNISSAAGKSTRPFMAPYSASKHAVEALSDGLRRELMDFGIEVIVIEPGPIQSEIWSKARETENVYRNTPYEKIYDNMNKAVDGMEGVAIPAEKVGELVVNAVEKKKPRTRYLIAPKKWLFWLAINVFPDRFLDKMLHKQIQELNK